MKKNFKDKNWKEHIPKPIFPKCPAYEELYIKAFELAHDHIKDVKGMPQTPYMDEAFCDTQIWIWDTCFMAQFCKFAGEVFPGVESLKNFYEVLYDEKILPQIMTNKNEPFWTGAIPGKMNDIVIHIADNPPLFAWTEYENAKLSGDIFHVKDLLYNKKYLQKHYEWLENLKAPITPKGVHCQTCLIAEDIGYRWEGGRSGMDNTPRGRKAIKDGNIRPNNPDMLWVDAICQQALSAKCIANLFELVGDESNSLIWQDKFNAKKEIVNRYYWDSNDKFYYDIDINTKEFYKVKTIASYWTLISGIADKEQAKCLVELISNPKFFGGDVPLISLSRDDGDYYPDGRYWRGGLWLPTAYMALRGIFDYGYYDEGRTAAKKIFEHMLKTYKEFNPHTIWECYSPEKPMPSLTDCGSSFVRPHFCGWSALGPISIYLEFILGFYSINAFNKEIKWAIPKEVSGKIGVKNLRFGNVKTDIILEDGVFYVNSNEPYTLIADGVEYKIKIGKNEFLI